MNPEIEEGLIRYLAGRDAERAGRVERTLSGMNPRERLLVREAAVMGFVRGTMHAAPAGRTAIPNDSAVLAEVIACCLGFPDLYPQVDRALRRAERRERGGSR